MEELNNERSINEEVDQLKKLVASLIQEYKDATQLFADQLFDMSQIVLTYLLILELLRYLLIKNNVIIEEDLDKEIEQLKTELLKMIIEK